MSDAINNRVLVVFCHPSPESFNASVKEAVLDTIQEAGAEVRVNDLYAREFNPVMEADELRNYLDTGRNRRGLEEDVESILWCNALVFIYPTWCYGAPAMLKGWLERCLLPGVAFDPTLGDSDTIPRGLAHITRLGVFTTCGASLALTHMMGSPGKNTFLRGVRALLALRCKTSFVAHYAMDKSTPTSRAAHLRKVRSKMRTLLT
ncbi:FMN-dependent NADH-azoreductase [Aliiroseovarius pelagivivens]|uniref:FMN-dependent NADH-azoreductase n=1 Tax=Aliiroseovarius pelagivivens TaxID=1639690 RepID=A0A2R8AMN3_9RHOB|nr:NAD(P)H-dependent oxidoreductase [Aliiroseovarius pelagivivens]SPF77147.1 FMN-dependent NADH-azoreductase [Aliiroseovarius pelagivivens]